MGCKMQIMIEDIRPGGGAMIAWRAYQTGLNSTNNASLPLNELRKCIDYKIVRGAPRTIKKYINVQKYARRNVKAFHPGGW